MKLYDLIPEEYLTEACWKGYTLRGTKKKGGRIVDNCVKVKRKKSNLKESLGFASKATGTAKRSAKPIVETDPMVERFKKLAGIK